MTLRPGQPLPETLSFGRLKTTSEMVEHYAALTGDYNPIHLDADFAANTSFGAPIVHGTMSLNLLVEALHRALGEDWGEMEIDVRFVRPIHVGATIMAGGVLSDRDARCSEIFVETDTGERAVEGTCRLRPITDADGNAGPGKTR
jgi:acyl dehydratase